MLGVLCHHLDSACEQGTDSSKKWVCSVTACHSCWPCHVPCWLAPWQIWPFCCTPYQRIGPGLFLFHYIHCFILPFGFPISPWNLFFKGSASLWGILVFSIYILIHTASHNDLLFIYWFLLLLSYSFSTYLFTDPSFSPFHTILSHRWYTVLDPQHLYFGWIQ